MQGYLAINSRLMLAKQHKKSERQRESPSDQETQFGTENKFMFMDECWIYDS